MPTFTREASAALVFLIAYILIFAWLLYAYITKRIKWHSRYTVLLFHVTIRLASQGCGIAFGILGLTNVNVFVAYLVLGAEGYFTLVLCAFRFLISWHQHNLPSHQSWLEHRSDPDQSPSEELPAARNNNNLISLLNLLPILANGTIVVGGSFLAASSQVDPASSEYQRRMNVAKITQITGQSVFLAIDVLLLVAILSTMVNEKKRSNGKIMHRTLVILLIVWFPLIVRGIFGVLQAAVWGLSYYNPQNFSPTGFTPRFTAIEYILGVLTEWLACVLLCSTYYTSRNDPSKKDFSTQKEEALILA